MNSEQWNEVKELFTRIADMPEGERDKALDDLTAGDAEVRREVEKLLVSDGDDETFFDNVSVIPNHPVIKDKIGNYNILEKIGEGGMGEVYLAQRADLPQKVALKIIRRDSDSTAVFRRFRRE
jgi:serine/threonine protein kinase